MVEPIMQPIATKRYWLAVLSRFFAVAVTGIFGVIVGIYCTEESRAGSTIAILMAIYMATVFVSVCVTQVYRISGEADRRCAEDAQRIAHDIEKQAQRDRDVTALAYQADLHFRALGGLADLSKDLLYLYMRWSDTDAGRSVCEPDMDRCKRAILKGICDLLTQDKRNYMGPTDYFKATLFRVDSENRFVLDACHYLSARNPRTEEIDRKKFPSQRWATAFRCYDDQEMQIIPNVPAEFRKGKEARWIALYPGQETRYGSMLCTPICLGERANHTYEVVAVLTLDTNRLDYFLDTNEYSSLWSGLLAPFRSLLSCLYLIQRFPGN